MLDLQSELYGVFKDEKFQTVTNDLARVGGVHVRISFTIAFLIQLFIFHSLSLLKISLSLARFLFLFHENHRL